MKRFTPIVIAILLATGCAKYPFEGWTKANTAAQIAIAGVSAYDLLVQTPYYIKHDCELNPLLTDDDQVIPYYIGTSVLHLFVTGMVKPKYRTAWQAFWLGGHVATVYHNKQRDDKWGRK